MTTVTRIPLEAIDEHDNATTIMRNMNLPVLLSKLREKQAFTTEQLERLDSPAHSVIERTGYLIQYVKKLHQRGMDLFVQSLKETSGQHAGHGRILALLEEYASEVSLRSPLLEVFERKRIEILAHLSLITFINKMLEMEVMSVHENMDVHNPHRATEDNILALMELLAQRPGAEGLLKFIECLHADPNPEHETLATILLDEARVVVQEHPRRMEIPQGDKTQLLLLERWRETGTPHDYAIKQAFKANEARLGKEVQVAVLLPYLLKQRVILADEASQLNQLPVEERAPRLVAMVAERGMKAIVGFAECLKQSSEHKKLARLFEVTSVKKSTQKTTSEKTSKLAVLVCNDTFIELKNDYEAEEENMGKYNKDFEDHRFTLQVCLERLGFTVVDFGAVLSRKTREEMVGGVKKTSRDELFQNEVVARCTRDAIVFIYLSGHQFPLKKERDSYCAAVLIDGASVVSRKTTQCLKLQDLSHWVELLPTDNVTFLIDCHHSHVVSYGKQRQPAEVEIMEDPWSTLSSTYGVVILFCLPDPTAMWRLRGTYREDDSVFGLLTEVFVKALVSWIRRGHKEEVSHRLFYEAMTFHWHKKGRLHNLFVPAIQGDVDRSFLGSSTHPYQQVLRADLPARDADGNYDLTKLQVATGTQLGLIKEDELVVFHILHPEVRVAGRILRAHPLAAIAEVREEARDKFSRLLKHIYEEEQPVSKDGSTEFVLVKKKFPFHLRDNFAVACHEFSQNDEETIKDYIKKSSQLLSFSPKKQLARLLVKKEGQFFTVEDREQVKKGTEGEGDGEKKFTNDILYKPRVKTIQNIKSVLEIMAWFKYVKNLRTQSHLTHFLCHLTCEKPLLSRATPLNQDYQIKASTHVGPYTAGEAILQFSDEPRFWCPDAKDPTPTLEVEFNKNHIMTALEVRGDPKVKGHIQDAELNYRKLVFCDECSAPKPKELGSIAVGCQEKALFVTFKPLEWKEEFCIALRLLSSAPARDGGRPHTQGISSMAVMYWQFLQPLADWAISPDPVNNPGGHAVLDLSRTENMLRWSGRGSHAMTFDLGTEMLIEKIELTCVPGTQPLHKFRVELHTPWLFETMRSIPSAWPYKFELEKPLVISNLQLCPVKWTEVPISVQLQIYGNREEKVVIVEEQEILLLHFVNYTEQHQFVYLYYLEETGKVEIVLSDVVKPKNGLKKLLKVQIPEGYDPPAKQITDHYRVLVSPKKMYLQPLRQFGLHEYLAVRSYNLCSLGRRTDIGKDEQWYEYRFTVVVKKGSRREH